MRYYRIVVGGQTLFTSHPNGNFAPPNPGALNIELDLITTAHATPSGGSFARIWGIGLDLINQAKDFNGQTIEIYGGLGVGFPLATQQAPYAGLLVKGYIMPAFGNWVGTDMTLDFVINAGNATSDAGSGATATGLPNGPENPANLIHAWKTGQKLADAIQQTLQVAYPDKTPVINISDNLIVNYADTGFYQNFDQYAAYIKDISSAIMNAGKPYAQGIYLGVQMAFVGDNIIVTDGTKPSTNNKTIQFNDLLGQPTWSVWLRSRSRQ